jgi:ATPase subunit of ABC transporter with duplicated ATPase domains
LSGQRNPRIDRCCRAGNTARRYVGARPLYHRGSVERDRRLASRSDLATLREELTRLEHQMSAGGGDLDAPMERYGEAQHAYEAMGGYDLEARARAALHGLEEAEQVGLGPQSTATGKFRVPYG